MPIFFVEEGKPEPEKNPWISKMGNQQQTQPTYDAMYRTQATLVEGNQYYHPCSGEQSFKKCYLLQIFLDFL